jgi:hypothetical protein
MADKIPFEDYPILRRLDNGAEIKAGWRGGNYMTWLECPGDRLVFGLVVEGDTASIVSEVNTHYLFIGKSRGFVSKPAYEFYGIARSGVAFCRETSQIKKLVDICYKSCIYHERWEDK